MTRALLVGKRPEVELGFAYVTEPPWEAVVIGSMELGALLHFDNEAVLTPLAREILEGSS